MGQPEASMLVLLLAACSGSQSDVKTVAPTPQPEGPAVTLPAAPAAAGESKTLELDTPGGMNGAPQGLAFIVPAGVAAQARAGALSDGSTGFELAVPTPGDAVVCSLPIALGADATLKTRMRVGEVVPGANDWMGLNVELRGRGPAGELVSPSGTRYALIRNFREKADWIEWEAKVVPPPGAVKGEFCWRFVNSTGTVEVDRLEVVAATSTAGAAASDVATPPPPAAERRWELDAPGGPNGAPQGFEFIVPGGTAGVTTSVGEVGGGTGFHFAESQVGTGVACSESFPVGTSQVAEARVKVTAVSADPRTWTGFVTEVRTYNAGGALVSPPGTSFTTLDVVKNPGDWRELAVPFTAPAGATIGRLCMRFVETTGAADVDWVAVKPG